MVDYPSSVGEFAKVSSAEVLQQPGTRMKPGSRPVAQYRRRSSVPDFEHGKKLSHQSAILFIVWHEVGCELHLHAHKFIVFFICWDSSSLRGWFTCALYM